MAKPHTATAIAAWAEQQAKPAHTPAYKRLTDTDRILIQRLSSEGYTQVEIAQRLGCDQSSVSRWLSACQDSTKEATAYLRGQALRMSRNIVQKGRAADHIKALEGINVLQPQASQPVQWQIGIRTDAVKLIQASFEPVNIITNYQTQTVGEGMTGQSVTGTPAAGFAGESEGRKSLAEGES